MILGLETSSRHGGVALLRPGDAALAADLGPPRAHAERLLPALFDLLSRAGAGWADVTRVAVGVGPGSFTGVRVGIASALGLARARGIPVVGVGSLDIIARACYDATSPRTEVYIIAAADVRRGEVALATFRGSDHGVAPETGERLVRVAEPGPLPPPGTWLAGDGAALLWPEAGALHRWLPTGEDVALAAARIGAERPEGGGEPVLPRYAREADARPRRR